MAKLADLIDWMARAMHGDAPRARSLVQVARKSGVFTTGGRGFGAPEMTADDAAKAVLLVLMDDPPTRCVDRLCRLSAIPFTQGRVWPDGSAGEGYEFDAEILKQEKPPLPYQYEVCPRNPLEAISWLYSADEHPYWLDSVRISKSRSVDIVRVEVFDLGKPVKWTSPGESDWFHFVTEYFNYTESECINETELTMDGVQSVRSLDGGSLYALYCLIRGVTSDELDAKKGLPPLDPADPFQAPGGEGMG